jgi:hypothetical protein
MKLALPDNALDSLNWALKHFKNFLNKDPYFENREKSSSDLKQAIINLNSCLELVFKKLISDSNEILIYDTDNNKETSEAILQFYKAKNLGQTDLPIYEYFIENKPNIKTISYSKCIKCFCEIYDVGAAYSAAFTHLNQLRNSVMHLGIDYKQQYYILVEYLDKVLWFIQYELLPKLIKRKSTLLKKQGAILPIESSFAEIGDTLWKQLYKKQIDSIANKLENTFNNGEVQSYLACQKRKVEFYSTNDMEHSSARMIVYADGIEEEMFSADHDPLTKSLIIEDDQQDATVFAVISLTVQGAIPAKFYCSKDSDGVLVRKIDHQSEFWVQQEYKNQFCYMDYNEKSIVGLMKKMIDYCNQVEFI